MTVDTFHLSNKTLGTISTHIIKRNIMARKILIVGGVAGGASVAARLRRHSEEDRIIIFEKGPHVSFSNCSLPYHLSGIVADSADLVLMNPQKFVSRYRIEVRTNNEVIAINRDAKTVTVKNLESGDAYTESYDKLVPPGGNKAPMAYIPIRKHS
jgi:NADPH-dependent 2,4-dienoyl-CoA reductase/sulfur reductase-like enzyme